MREDDTKLVLWVRFKGSRSNENKHELVYGESSSNARDAPNVCLSFVLLLYLLYCTLLLIVHRYM